jgi:flagellar basal-body rod protein FlgC
MDLTTVFEVSAAGMSLQRLRLDVAAANLANAQTSAVDGVGYQPLQVVAHAPLTAPFAQWLSAAQLRPADVRVVESASVPRLVYEPGHPDADARGYVAYPDVSPVSEMVRLMEISRAYEANVRALNLAKAMAVRALEIGTER